MVRNNPQEAVWEEIRDKAPWNVIRDGALLEAMAFGWSAAVIFSTLPVAALVLFSDMSVSDVGLMFIMIPVSIVGFIILYSIVWIVAVYVAAVVWLSMQVSELVDRG